MSTIASLKLVRVRYLDHVEFSKMDPSVVKLSLREVVGWLFAQDMETVTILSDRPLRIQEGEWPSGFRIMRSDIKEIKEIG